MVIATQAQSKILIPISVVRKGKEFYTTSVAEALRACQQEGYEALFAPLIAQARIAAAENKDKEAVLQEIIWQKWWDTASVIATGKTKAGKAVVAVGHVPNYLSNPDNIEAALNQGLVNGAGILPQDGFDRLLGMEDGKTVFVIDYDAVVRAGSGIMTLAKAEKHPLAVPFVGAKSTLDAYLATHKRVIGEKIGVGYKEAVGAVPVGRLLAFGDDFTDVLGFLFGDDLLDYFGRFVGVRQGAEGATPQKQAERSPLEALVGLGTPVGNQGLVVVDGNKLPPEAYKALTGQNRQV